MRTCSSTRGKVHPAPHHPNKLLKDSNDPPVVMVMTCFVVWFQSDCDFWVYALVIVPGLVPEHFVSNDHVTSLVSSLLDLCRLQNKAPKLPEIPTVLKAA